MKGEEVYYSLKCDDTKVYISRIDWRERKIFTTRDQFEAARLTEDVWQEAIDDGIIMEDGSWVSFPALDDKAIDMEAYRRARRSRG